MNADERTDKIWEEIKNQEFVGKMDIWDFINKHICQAQEEAEKRGAELEREACAKVAEMEATDSPDDSYSAACDNIAFSIRLRGEE